MSDEKNKLPKIPQTPKEDISKGKDSTGESMPNLNEDVNWERIDKQRGNFTNNLPDYDPPPPPTSKKDDQ